VNIIKILGWVWDKMECENCEDADACYNYNGVKCCHDCLMENFNDNPDEREYFMENHSLADIKIK